MPHQIIVQADRSGGTFRILSDGKPIKGATGVDVSIRIDPKGKVIETLSVVVVDSKGELQALEPKELVIDADAKQPTSTKEK